MGIGGALALGAAVHVFVGMVEAPLLVRPYLARMQRGELFALMTCGMAGVAGTVMVIYGVVPFADRAERAGQHPDRLGDQHAGRAGDRGIDGAVRHTRSRPKPGWSCATRRSSSLDALVKGTLDGIPILAGIIAVLIVAVASVALMNMALGLLPPWDDAPVTLQRLFAAAVPAGDVADRRALGGNRRRGDADGDQDRAERVRRLSAFSTLPPDTFYARAPASS